MERGRPCIWEVSKPQTPWCGILGPLLLLSLPLSLLLLLLLLLVLLLLAAAASAAASAAAAFAAAIADAALLLLLMVLVLLLPLLLLPAVACKFLLRNAVLCARTVNAAEIDYVPGRQSRANVPN